MDIVIRSLEQITPLDPLDPAFDQLGDLVASPLSIANVVLADVHWVQDRPNAPAGEAGYWKANTPNQPITVMAKDFLEIDAGTEYVFTAKMRQADAATLADQELGHAFIGFACFDREDNYIAPYHVYETPKTRTKLTTDLKAGDTEVHVVSTVNWPEPPAAGPITHEHSIIFWNYRDKAGKRWFPGTYSRNVLIAGYKNLGIAADTRTIYLDKPWDRPTVPLGTELSNTKSNSTYVYDPDPAVHNVKVPGVWTTYRASIKGFSAPGTLGERNLWQGTAKIKPLLLINRNEHVDTTGLHGNSDIWVAATDLSFPEATCYQSTMYGGGSMTVYVQNLNVPKVDIWRTDRHGSNAMMIRAGLGITPVNGRVVVVDPEVPFNEVVIYKIAAPSGDPTKPGTVITQTTGCQVASASSLPEDTSICSPVYLSDPLSGDGDWFGLLGIDSLAYPSRSALYDILNRHAPVAVSQLRSEARTSIRLLTRNKAERATLLKMLATGRILQYRNPDPSYPESNWYVSVGEISEERISPDHRDWNRRWTLEVAVVDRPVGALVAIQSNRTYDTYSTYEPDGRSPIAPNRYGSPSLGGAYTDYTDYVHVLIGGASAQATGDGKKKSGDEPDLTYGDSIYPTIQAAQTSWSLM